jgi:hypothetical protein
MVPESKHLSRYLQEAAIEDTVERYTERGYMVAREVHEGDLRFDLVAIKGEDRVYFDFRVGNGNGKKDQDVIALQEHARGRGGEFHIVYVTPPRDAEFWIEGLDLAIDRHLTEEPPAEIDILSSHSRIKEVVDLTLRKATVTADRISAEGTFLLGVILQYGSDGDMARGDGSEDVMYFPTSFTVDASRDLSEMSLQTTVDTSSFED